MANKKLKVGAGELKLSAKKSKEDKKPKWQAKTGGKRAKELVPEEPAQEEPTVKSEPTELPVVATTPEALEAESTATGEAATTPDPELAVPDVPATEEPATNDEPAPKKSRKLKVQADLKPKKLSMIKAALQVLQDRKVPMTCPELIDVMATETLWVSPGGKSPASTLYAAISRSIKDVGKASPFKKSERGKFAAKILPKQ
jgi:hypothetical protein